MYPEKKTDCFSYMEHAYYKAWNAYCGMINGLRRFNDPVVASVEVKMVNRYLDDFWGSRSYYYDVLHGHRGIGCVGIGVLPVRVSVVDDHLATFYH